MLRILATLLPSNSTLSQCQLLGFLQDCHNQHILHLNWKFHKDPLSGRNTVLQLHRTHVSQMPHYTFYNTHARSKNVYIHACFHNKTRYLYPRTSHNCLLCSTALSNYLEADCSPCKHIVPYHSRTRVCNGKRRHCKREGICTMDNDM